MTSNSLRAVLTSLVPAKFKTLLKGWATRARGRGPATPDCQDLEMYWDGQFAQVLETWGINSTWREIPLLLADCRGKVIDVACGTGKTIEILKCLPALEIHGCDISDFLIQKTALRGLKPERFRVCDATRMPYSDNQFDYSYSIGSLEHFTEDGIGRVIQECYRITRRTSMHMMPVSRSDRNEGWIKTRQSFFNNSVSWWLRQFRAVYPTVHALDSSWNDPISVGKWFVCVKEDCGSC
jgi:ubiquinone/menaquinone biosynthesis C-methylase UbiE